jgi:hypothetical protein
MTIALTRPTNVNQAEIMQSNNCNVFGIFTDKKYGGSLDSKILGQICTKINGVSKPIADFQTYGQSVDFIISYFSSFIDVMGGELIKVNTNVDINKSYAESIAQIIYTTFDTIKAFNGGENGEKLTTQQIKDTTLADKTAGTFTYYDEYVKNSYEIYIKL